MDTQETEFQTTYLDSIDNFVDNGFTEIISFFNENGLETLYSCSGLFQDHYTDDQQTELKNRENTEELEEHPYISFKPVYHTIDESSNVSVDRKYYEFKTKLQHTCYIRLFSQESLQSIVPIQIEVGESGHPYADKVTHSCHVRIVSDSTRALFEEVQYDTYKYDTILKTIFKLLQARFTYPALFSDVEIHYDLDTDQILCQLNQVSELPETFDQSKFTITTDQVTILHPDNTETKHDTYNIKGLFEDIYTELGEIQTDSYHQQLRSYGDDYKLDIPANFSHKNL